MLVSITIFVEKMYRKQRVYKQSLLEWLMHEYFLVIVSVAKFPSIYSCTIYFSVYFVFLVLFLIYLSVYLIVLIKTRLRRYPIMLDSGIFLTNTCVVVSHSMKDTAKLAINICTLRHPLSTLIVPFLFIKLPLLGMFSRETDVALRISEGNKYISPRIFLAIKLSTLTRFCFPSYRENFSVAKRLIFFPLFFSLYTFSPLPIWL